MSFRSLETEEEVGFVKELKRWTIQSSVTVITLKLYIPGNRGWPDRIVLWEGPSLMFIEFKRPGDIRPRKLQEYIHNILRGLGFIVEVHNDRHTALDSVKAKVQSKAAAIKGPRADR